MMDKQRVGKGNTTRMRGSGDIGAHHSIFYAISEITTPGKGNSKQKIKYIFSVKMLTVLSLRYVYVFFSCFPYAYVREKKTMSG